MAGTLLPIDGLLIVDKPPGWTSHDVVARMRRLTGVRRIGHAGTLDPLATGVLPLGIGQGTRVLEYVSDARKTYVATVRLGITTDTYDADGAVLDTRDCAGVTAERVRTALAGFVGEIAQRPPAYSAIKQGGVPLHRLARAGRTVEAPARRVTVFAIEDVAFDAPLVRFAVRCSKGTYVRSLAHDLGERLGCGAHLAALRRTATGGFTIEQAIALERWEAALADGSWPVHILPLDAPLLDDLAVILADRSARRLGDGVAPPPPDVLPRDGIIRAYGADGLLIGLLRPGGVEAGWRVEKVFQRPLSAGTDAADP
jgi:tRNA pseudouridine55 synthase